MYYHVHINCCYQEQIAFNVCSRTLGTAKSIMLGLRRCGYLSVLALRSRASEQKSRDQAQFLPIANLDPG